MVGRTLPVIGSPTSTPDAPSGLSGINRNHCPASVGSTVHLASESLSAFPRIPHFIRQRLGSRVHFWPFDGWDIPAGRSAIAEVYPALWSRHFARSDRTSDQNDAFSIAAWLSRADREGSLAAFLKPDLTPLKRAVAQVAGGYWAFPA